MNNKIRRNIATLILALAAAIPLSLAAAGDGGTLQQPAAATLTPRETAERAAERARVAKANAQEALEAAHRAQALAEAAHRDAEAAKLALRRADSLRIAADSMVIVERIVQPITVSQVVEQMHQNADSLLLLERVLVGNDTVRLIIPERNFGRFDRGLHNFLFIPKGKWAFGLTASYGEFDTEDVQVLSFLKDFNFKGSMFSLSPSVSYFVRHNTAVGMKLGYSRNKFTLGSLILFHGLLVEVSRVDGSLCRLGTSIHHAFQRVLFVSSISFDGIDQIGDQVGTTLVLVLHLTPCGLDSFVLCDEIVVHSFGPEKQQHGQSYNDPK